ncbi:hypothetical protein TNCV_1378531 [Trichonephila clavipes]|nr:hypothetical protein TNCV_1378531 [Trichonephila clavipes]
MCQANQQFSSILTKIGNGEQLDEMEITLIESLFCTVEEAEARCLKIMSSDYKELARYDEKSTCNGNKLSDPFVQRDCTCI